MDSAIIESANGLPLVFETYEKYNGNTWEIVQNQFPAAGERIRSLKSDRNQVKRLEMNNLYKPQNHHGLRDWLEENAASAKDCWVVIDRNQT